MDNYLNRKLGRVGMSYSDYKNFLLEEGDKDKKIDKTLFEEASSVHKKGEEIGSELQNFAEKIAKKYDGFVSPLNYKSIDSICRKCKLNDLKPIELGDTVRNTIIVKNKDISSVLKDLENSKYFLKKKEQKKENYNGYSGNIVNFKMSNGIIAEIQVNTSYMIYAKERKEVAVNYFGGGEKGEKIWKSINKKVGIEGGLGHKYYEKIRDLRFKLKEQKISSQEKKELESLIKKSIEYYEQIRKSY